MFNVVMLIPTQFHAVNLALKFWWRLWSAELLLTPLPLFHALIRVATKKCDAIYGRSFNRICLFIGKFPFSVRHLFKHLHSLLSWMNVSVIGKQNPLFPWSTSFRRNIIKANIVPSKVKTKRIFNLISTQLKKNCQTN